MRGLGALFLLIALGVHWDASAQRNWQTQYNEEFAEALFEHYVLEFRAELNLPLFIENLQKIKNGDSLSGRHKEFVIKPRIEAQKIRAIFEFFSEQHETPPEFNEFVVVWGYLKDALLANTDAREHARTMLKMIRQGSLDFLEEEFDPAKLGDVILYLREQLKRIRNLASHERLKANKFHRLRKSLRSINAILKALNLEFGEYETFVLEIRSIEQKMGLKHDKRERRELRKKKVKKSFRVPERVLPLVRQAERVLLHPKSGSRTCRHTLN